MGKGSWLFKISFLLENRVHENGGFLKKSCYYSNNFNFYVFLGRRIWNRLLNYKCVIYLSSQDASEDTWRCW